MDDLKVKFENGVFEMANDIYHSSEGLSRSALMEFKRSPYHYWYKYLNPEALPKEPTDAMILGNLIHTMVLEPDKFQEEFVMKQKFDRRTNIGKEGYGKYMMSLRGRIEITEQDLVIANAINKSIEEHDVASKLLQGCDIEKSIYFTHEPTGIQCKARPDAWINGLVIDLKSSKDASYRAFQGAAYAGGYFLQAGMIYCALRSIDVELKTFITLAAEKVPPYALGIYALDKEAIDFGVNQFDHLMESFDRCVQSNNWPGYPFQYMSVPGYAKHDEFQMESEDE